MLKPGVNVYGYVFAESGVGEHTRLLVETLREAGRAYSVIPFTKTASRQESTFADFGTGKPEFDVNIVGVNADSMPLFLESFGRSALAGRYTIGLWAWELEHFPTWMARSADLVDEVWANSSFSARAISSEVCCPVQPFPLPISTPVPPPRSRADLGLPDGFLFMFTFDLDSIVGRKNPSAAIAAFKLAFPPGSGAKLVVKSINGERHQAEVDELRRAAADHADVTYLDGYLPGNDQKAFLAACDCYVSLHRAEGFGLTMAEAMTLGKPVIGTGYSGNLDFMTIQNSYLVPYEVVPIGAGSDPYPADAVWAEPSVPSAAQLMRHVFEHPEDVAHRVARATRDIAAAHSPRARARFVLHRLARIRDELDRRARTAPLPARPPAAAVAAPIPAERDELDRLLGDVAALVERGPDLDRHAALGGLGKALRRLALRAVRNFTLHQQEVDLALLRALHEVLVRVQTPTVAAAGDPAVAALDPGLARHLLVAAQIADETAPACDGERGRDLRLLAARLRGLVK